MLVWYGPASTEGISEMLDPLGPIAEEQHLEGVLRVLGGDQLRQREGDGLGRRDPVLAVEDHRVGDVDRQDGGAGGQVLGLVDLEVVLGQLEGPLGALQGVVQRARRVQVVEVVAEAPRPGLRQPLDPFAGRPHRVVAGARVGEPGEDVLEGAAPDAPLAGDGQLQAALFVPSDQAPILERGEEPFEVHALVEVAAPLELAHPLHRLLRIAARRQDELVEQAQQVELRQKRAEELRVEIAVAVPHPPPWGPAMGSKQLELDHLLVADLAVQVLAGELQVLVQPFEDHLGVERLERRRAAAVLGRQLPQARHPAQLGGVLGDRLLVVEGDGVAVGEPGDDLGVGPDVVLAARSDALGDLGEGAVEHPLDRFADQPARHHLGALLLALVDHLHLAGDRRQQHVEIAQTRVDRVLARGQRAPLQVRGEQLHGRDRHPGRDAGGLVDQVALPRHEGDLLDQQADLLRDHHAVAALGPCLLAGDLGGDRGLRRVVGEDLGRDPVLERRDDRAPVGVVLRVGGEDHQQVERDAHGEAPDLEVALLQDVEQPHLDARREVGQLVDGEDPPVGPRHDAEVDDLRVGEGELARGRLDRVDVAEEIGDRHVRRRELLVVALVPGHPLDRRVVAVLLEQPLALGRDRRQRIVVELGAGEHRDLRVEQADQRAQQPGLGLAAQPEQDEVVPGEQRVDDPGDHRALVAEHSGEQALAGRQLGAEVLADLLLDRARAVACGLELSDGARALGHRWVSPGSRASARRPSPRGSRCRRR